MISIFLIIPSYYILVVFAVKICVGFTIVLITDFLGESKLPEQHQIQFDNHDNDEEDIVGLGDSEEVENNNEQEQDDVFLWDLNNKFGKNGA